MISMESILSGLLSSGVLWTVLALVVGVWFSVSWVLNYHWKTYGHHKSTVSRARIVYFVGSLLLLAFIVLLIITL